MTWLVTFEGGPADQESFTLVSGDLPSYMMLMHMGDRVFGEGFHLVVGFGFNDGWPDSHRYDLSEVEYDSNWAYYTYVDPARGFAGTS